jgi:Lon-like protease
VGLNQQIPYYALYPGGATPVNALVQLPADKAFPAKGNFLLTTVSVGPTNVFEAARGWLDPDIDVVPERELFGDQTPEQFSQVAAEAIDNSKQVAVAVAFRRLGMDVRVTGAGALVEQVVPGSPAAATLAPGDTVVAAAGQPVQTVEDLRSRVAGRQPGETVDLEVAGPDGQRRASSVTLIACPANFDCPGGGNAALGLALRTRDENFDFPFEIGIESQDIGGPSAGLAFTLTVLDLLSPGELTGGISIAVTGTIAIDGTVGAIGGVGQKAAAVRDQGIRVFIVPEGSNAEEARRHAGDDLLIVPVRNLEDAITALGRLGGDLTALGAP